MIRSDNQIYLTNVLNYQQEVTNVKFSEFMKKVRGDMSLYELSKRTGISAQQLANYENGRSRATIEKAVKICEVLNVTFTIGGKGDE